MKKSYHSMVVPMRLAAATFLIAEICPRSSPPNLSIRTPSHQRSRPRKFQQLPADRSNGILLPPLIPTNRLVSPGTRDNRYFRDARVSPTRGVRRATLE